MRWEDVDPDDSAPRVLATLQRIDGALPGKEPRAKLSRCELMPPLSLIASLSVHRELQAADQPVTGATWQQTGRVFTTGNGTSVDWSNIQKRFVALIVAVGPSKEVVFRGFRRQVFSLMAPERASLPTMMPVLGHGQIGRHRASTTAPSQGNWLAADTMEQALSSYLAACGHKTRADRSIQDARAPFWASRAGK